MEIHSADTQGSHPKKENILGVMVSSINMNEAVRTIDSWIRNRSPHYVTVTPAHSIMDAYQDLELRRIINHSGMTTPDGMSIVWILKLLGHSHTERVYGPDLMLELCRYGVSRKWRHFFLGGDVGVADALAQRLLNRYPALQVSGTYSPPFRNLTEVEQREIREIVDASNSDVLWIGLSSPKQEYWMAEHFEKIDVPVMIGVGAAFDFLSGNKPQAPRWIQRSGFEWLFRLITEPQRLWPRYRQYPRFAFLVAAQLLGLKSYAEEESSNEV